MKYTYPCSQAGARKDNGAQAPYPRGGSKSICLAFGCQALLRGTPGRVHRAFQVQDPSDYCLAVPLRHGRRGGEEACRLAGHRTPAQPGEHEEVPSHELKDLFLSKFLCNICFF